MWSLVRFLHVVAAMVWVGGQLLLSGVVLPVLRSHLDAETRAPLVGATARRFAAVANIVVLPVSLATGLALAWHRGVALESFSRPGYGRLLSIKLVLVLVAVVMAALHGVLAGRDPGKARSTAIGALGASLLVVVFATALVP